MKSIESAKLTTGVLYWLFTFHSLAGIPRVCLESVECSGEFRRNVRIYGSGALSTGHELLRESVLQAR